MFINLDMSNTAWDIVTLYITNNRDMSIGIQLLQTTDMTIRIQLKTSFEIT